MFPLYTPRENLMLPYDIEIENYPEIASYKLKLIPLVC